MGDVFVSQARWALLSLIVNLDEDIEEEKEWNLPLSITLF